MTITIQESTTLVSDFDANPQVFCGETSVRFFDKTVCTCTHYTNINGFHYSEIVDTTRPVSWSWTSSVGTFVDSTKENPILVVPAGATGTINISLTATAADGTTDIETKTAYLTRYSAPASEPGVGGTFNDIKIFLYTPNHTLVAERNLGPNNVFFQNLVCSEYLDKVGSASFTLVDPALTTSDDRELFVANTNVIITISDKVVWSGKIRKAIQGKLSPYEINPPYQTFDITCESDIIKMEMQNVIAANKARYVTSPGYIVEKIVEGASPDIDWGGLITYEGPNIEYTINDEDMLTQFRRISKITGYDWRTSNTITTTIETFSGGSSRAVYPNPIGEEAHIQDLNSPHVTNALSGKHIYYRVLETTEWIYLGVCTSNTSTTVYFDYRFGAEASIIPSIEYIAKTFAFNTPTVDFSSDLGQITCVSTFQQNQYNPAIPNCYEFNDKSDYKAIATKVITRGKSIPIVSSDVPVTLSAAMAAKDKWDDNNLWFDNSTYISYNTSAYVYTTYTAAGVRIIGWDNAFQVGDRVYLYVHTTGTPYALISTIADWAITQDTQNTVKTTLIPLNPQCMLGSGPNYISSFFLSDRLYLKEPENLHLTVDNTPINIGTSTGTDTVYVFKDIYIDPIYGEYIKINFAHLPTSGIYYVHKVGAIVSNQTYSEASPQQYSPIDNFGLLTKTFTTDQSVTPSDLEAHTTVYLLNHSYYYRKGTMWCLVHDFYKTDTDGTARPIEVGDRIGVLQRVGDTIDDMEFGQYKNRWQIVGYTFDANTLRVTVELGDFDRNLFNLISDKTISVTDSLI